MERGDDRYSRTQRHSLLPYSGTESRYRVRASAVGRRSHHASPYHVPRSDERLRQKAYRKMKTRLAAAAILLSIGLPATAHRLDEYLQATLISVEQERIHAQIRLT